MVVFLQTYFFILLVVAVVPAVPPLTTLHGRRWLADQDFEMKLFIPTCPEYTFLFPVRALLQVQFVVRSPDSIYFGLICILSTHMPRLRPT